MNETKFNNKYLTDFISTSWCAIFGIGVFGCKTFIETNQMYINLILQNISQQVELTIREKEYPVPYLTLLSVSRENIIRGFKNKQQIIL